MWDRCVFTFSGGRSPGLISGREWGTMHVMSLPRVPTRTGKPGIMGRHFPVRAQTKSRGKVWENHTKYWKTKRISNKCYLLL